MLKLSVIIVNTASPHIQKCVDSLISQDFKDYEIIIVDNRMIAGGDSPEYDEIISDLKGENKRLQIFNQKKEGLSVARNIGIQASMGEYVALLNGDDWWGETYLSEQMKMIDDFPEAAMCGIRHADVSGDKLVRKTHTGLPSGYRWYVYDYFQMLGYSDELYTPSSVVIKKTVFDEVGYFDERILKSEDTDMLYRIIATHKVAYFDRYLSFHSCDANKEQNVKLSDSLPYYVGKYKEPMYKSNEAFCKWINLRAARQLRFYYFNENKEERADAKTVVKNLDYAAIASIYKRLFNLPYPIASILNIFR